MYTHIYTHRHTHGCKRWAMNSPKEKKKVEFWKQCHLSDFSVPLEVSKSDIEQRAVIEGTSLCLWTVTDLFQQASAVPSIQPAPAAADQHTHHASCSDTSPACMEVLRIMHRTEWRTREGHQLHWFKLEANQQQMQSASARLLLCTAKQQHYTAPVQNVVFLLHLGSGGMTTASLECKQFASVKCNLSMPCVSFLFWGIPWAEAPSSAKYIRIRWMIAAFVF